MSATDGVVVSSFGVVGISDDSGWVLSSSARVVEVVSASGVEVVVNPSGSQLAPVHITGGSVVSEVI